jgi:transposase-like protein
MQCTNLRKEERVVKMFDFFDLVWPESAEEALIFTALSDNHGEIRCPKCSSTLELQKDKNYLCKKCRIKFKG